MPGQREAPRRLRRAAVKDGIDRNQESRREGDGGALKRFRWWQLPGRALFYVRVAADEGRETEYAVDVRHWGNQTSGKLTARLYRNGAHHAESRVPAAFPSTAAISRSR